MMIRTFATLAALTAVAALASTASAEEARLNLAGKSAAQQYAAIARAAHAVCQLGAADAVYAPYLTSNCTADTISATVAKIADPNLTQYVKARSEFLQVASR